MAHDERSYDYGFKSLAPGPAGSSKQRSRYLHNLLSESATSQPAADLYQYRRTKLSRATSLQSNTIPATSSLSLSLTSPCITSKITSGTFRTLRSKDSPEPILTRNASLNERKNQVFSKMKWFNRSRADEEVSRGTILRAVPDSSQYRGTTYPLLPIDETVPTSPNEEVLSAIGKPSSETSQGAYVSPLTPPQPFKPLESPYIPAHWPRSSGSRHDGYLGTWKGDGIYWATGEVSKIQPTYMSHHVSGHGPRSSSEDTTSTRESGPEYILRSSAMKVQIPTSKFASPLHPPALFSSGGSRPSKEYTRPNTNFSPRHVNTPVTKLTKAEIQEIISPLAQMDRPQHPLEAAEEASVLPSHGMMLDSLDFFSSFDDNASRHSGSTVPSYDVPTPDKLSSKSWESLRQQGVDEESSYNDQAFNSPSPSSPSASQPAPLSSTIDRAEIYDLPSAINQDEPPTPELPARSRKRDWVRTPTTRNFSRPAGPQDRPGMTRRSTDPEAMEILPLAIGHERSKMDFDEPALPHVLSQYLEPDSPTGISADTAEIVIRRIFEHITDFKDLFAAARVNKGFYSVFKRHELQLLKCTLRNASAAAWELRESSPKEIIASLEKSNSEYTPVRYVQFHRRDTYILQTLKSLILVRCQSYLRQETIRGLADRNAPQANEINDALWRIWTFCTIFGNGRGREEDIVGQIDWLRGGVVAHQSTPEANIQSTVAIDSSSVLLNPPSSFARGNTGGLSAKELYNMTEMWNCILGLLSPISSQDRIQQAREHGIFKDHNVQEGDTYAEQRLLEEWVYFIAAQGLSTICDLAGPANTNDASVFIVAADMGWNKWKVPDLGGSRSTFLKEAISRVYEQRIAALNSPSSPKEHDEAEAKRHRRLRSAEMAQELKLRKEATDFSKLPYSEERPMSMWLHWSAKEDNQVPKNASNASDEDKAFDNSTAEITKKSALKSSGTKARKSNGLLSLFPPQYRNGSAAATTTKLSPTEPTNASSRTSMSALKSALTTKVMTGLTSHTSSNTSAAAHPASVQPSKTTVASTSVTTTLTPAIPKSYSAGPPSSRPKTAPHPPASHAKAFAGAQEITSYIELPPASPRSPRSNPQTPRSPPAQSSLQNELPKPLPSLPASRTAAVEKNVVIQSVHNIHSESVMPSIPSSSDLAIARIVEMGFDAKDAKRALMKTDRGARLDVDRAVALLLTGE